MRELALHLLDIAQNSIAAGASLIEIKVREDISTDLLVLEINDNGQGMDEELARVITDPFVTSRKTREVGLGLPLLKQACENCAGELKIISSPGKGTRVKASFQHSHIDRAPLGDLPGTIVALIATNPQLDFDYHHWKDGQEFSFRTEDIKKELDGLAINHPQVLKWLEEYIRQGLREISGGES